jgi:hypothetical protein
MAICIPMRRRVYVGDIPCSGREGEELICQLGFALLQTRVCRSALDDERRASAADEGRLNRSFSQAVFEGEEDVLPGVL